MKRIVTVLYILTTPTVSSRTGYLIKQPLMFHQKDLCGILDVLHIATSWGHSRDMEGWRDAAPCRS
jgi:hypothetical protein